eukprot:4090201-Amphidinium_carterae.1
MTNAQFLKGCRSCVVHSPRARHKRCTRQHGTKNTCSVNTLMPDLFANLRQGRVAWARMTRKAPSNCLSSFRTRKRDAMAYCWEALQLRPPGAAPSQQRFFRGRPSRPRSHSKKVKMCHISSGQAMHPPSSKPSRAAD